MNYNFRVIVSDKSIPFNTAIKKKYVTITVDGIVAKENVTLEESSGLFDAKNNEIFENDILRSYDGKRFIIKRFAGTFYIKDLEEAKGGLLFALSGLKFGNKIDNMYKE